MTIITFACTKVISTAESLSSTIRLAGQKDIPFGANLIFKSGHMKNFNLYFEICEDLWAPIPPSSYAALAGATVIGNLSGFEYQS